MKNRIVSAIAGLIGLAAGLGLRGFQPPAPEKVYYGEAQPGATADVITLNVAPCEKMPNLQTISPYKKVGDEQASCEGGKKYTKIAVQVLPALSAKDDKNKASPPKSGDASKDKSAEDTKGKK
jgi:hypothetical protein